MPNDRSEMLDSVKRVAVLALLLIAFHWAPDLYVWFSSNVLGRHVIIDARRYQYILWIAYVICGLGIVAGITDVVIRRCRRRKR